MGIYADALALLRGTITDAPTISVNQVVAGAGATATVFGNNISGIITLTTGTTITTGGSVMTMTLANGASFPGGMVVHITAASSSFANMVPMIFITTTTNTATLYVNGLSLAASTVYKGNYLITGW